MNIFNWAQDNNVLFLENMDYWLMKHIPRKLYSIITQNNVLSDGREKRVCEKKFNHIGFHWGNGEIGRLIGFGDDGEDYYYIIKYVGGKIVWNSMVGGFCSLKGRIPNWDYDQLESIHTLNECPKEEKFIVDIRNESLWNDGLSDVND